MKIISFFVILITFFIVPSISISQDKEYKIGVILGMTGPASYWSKYQKMGVELAKKDLLKQGIKVKLVYEDSNTSPLKAVSAYNKLMQIDRVDAVLGDVFSHITEPLIPMAKKYKKLLITPSSNMSACQKDNDYFFSTASQVNYSSVAYAKFLKDRPSLKKLALVYFDAPAWGTIIADGWRKEAKKLGVEIVSEFNSQKFDEDFKLVLSKILKEKPDVLFVAHEPKSFLKAAKQFKYKGKIVFANNILEVMDGSDQEKELLKGVYYVDTFLSQSFKDLFKKEYNEHPILEPDSSYDALKLLVANIDNPKIQNSKYTGINGNYDFNGTCAGNDSDWVLKQFTDTLEIITVN